MELHEIGLLFLAGIFAGFVNTMAGGGSLLTLPLMIFLGLPPAVANGTNRIGIVISSLSATVGYKSKQVSTQPFSVFLGIAALFGALIGAKIAIDIRGDLFNRILAVIMIAVVMTMVFKPKFSTHKAVERLSGKHLWMSVIAFFFIGIYGGFINAGIGFVIMLFLNFYNRMNLVRVNATKVAVVFIYSVGALATFALSDNVHWLYGFCLAGGTSFGAWTASRYSVKKGEGVIKFFMILMVVVMSVRLWFF
jgi:uncharacterized membrane protein YfcA